MAPDVAQLLQMSQSQLDALFSTSPPGPIPDGEAQGTAIIAPGTRFSSELAEFVSVFGQVFRSRAITAITCDHGDC